MSKADGMTCKSCRFWDNEAIHSTGLCRRHAPRAVVVVDKAAARCEIATWPETEPDDWCGDYQPPPLAQVREQVGKGENKP